LLEIFTLGLKNIKPANTGDITFTNSSLTVQNYTPPILYDGWTTIDTSLPAPGFSFILAADPDSEAASRSSTLHLILNPVNLTTGVFNSTLSMTHSEGVDELAITLEILGPDKSIAF